MLPHALSHEASGKCVVCKAEIHGVSHRVVGLGTVCMRCGLEPVECDSCGSKVKRMTLTYLRGRPLCLICYGRERERSAKRTSVSIDGFGLGPEGILRAAMEKMPPGYVLVGLRLNPNSKTSWVAEYEREDVYSMRCG
ncbi:MAG: hypothetical protein NZ920_02380 [Aigarchaeota archaeon]|nr:hypothetical protein [Aigarchaeota archaeon]MDW8092527.1 hypothetical protein [Nitrososphaerota archaeon]